MSQFAARYNATDGAFDVGAFSFRGKTRADGQFEVEMALRGSQAPQWSTVFTGDGDSVVKGLQTYEWDVGATGSATWKPGESGSDPSGSLGEYSRLKPFNTFWVFEKDQGDNAINAQNDLDNTSFRVRTYFPFPVFTEGAGSTDGQAGGSLSGNYWVDLRWGRMDGPPAPTNPGRMLEWGVNLNLGVSGATNLIQDAIGGDWAAVGQDAISLPKAGVNFSLWQFGLFGLKAAAGKVADQILGRQPDENAEGLFNDTGDARWYRTVPSNIVRYIGDTLQHWGVVGTLGAQVFAQPNLGTDAQSRSTSATQDSSQSAVLPDGLPAEFASLFAGFEGIAQPLDGVFDALENLDLSKLTAVAQGASTAIAAFAAAKEFVQAFKSRGASLFQNLDEDGKTKLLDLVMEEATRLMLEQSGMGPPSVTPDSTAPTMLSADQQQKSLLMLPGETAAQYATRLGENIAANIGQAVKNVMLNEQTWNDLEPHWNSPENSNPSDPGGDSGGGQGGGVGGGAAAGSGLAGALGGVAGAVAGAIATIGALVGSVSNDPAAGNNDALNAALTQAQDVLTDAQALLQLIVEGGSNVGIGSIADMQQRSRDAVAALQSAIAENPTVSDDIKNQVNGEVIPALQSVDANLQALLDDSGELSDSALNNMLGWPDGAAQQLPDDVVNQLIAADPAAVSALWAGGMPAELIVRVLPELLPGDLDVPGFVPVLVADLQNAMASAGTADAVTDAQIADAVVHARYQDLITAEQYSDPQVRQDLATAQTRFAVPLIRDALQGGYSPAEMVTAQSSEELQYILDTAPLTDDGEVLFQEFQAAMDRGWTLSELAKVAHLVEGYPTPPIDDSQVGPEGLGSSRPFIAKALHLLHLDEVRDEAFMSQLQRTYNSLDTVQVGSSSGSIQLPIERAIINTRYQGYATQDELDDPRFFEALYYADTTLHITDRQAAVDYARAAVAPSEPPAPAAPTGLTVSVNGQSFDVADPTLIAQIQDAASRGDFATVANLIGPVVVQGEYGEGPNFTLPLTPDGVPIYLPGPTQENDGTTFENASGTTTAGDGGNDYTLSFDHESFIFDIDAGPIADSVHYDVSLDFH